ncbi:low molecular weight protein arginine phosphatase [Halalkalibacillus sediminis]|uniref:Low molecular weight protein arginine phosphatase n=1 Tax=Halalkalibacillus sediminis TaxID=2018042 RepID=A0A2I0QUH4_9BACI|nr:low molecular weight protein arginine phosphatase [Halalkalibacillus sediminis]PKR77740.1 low molecular weight protein arginine phosphatase [Halalkalibacillus sediminis]
MKRVLFVCTGNTCRSPMAEAVMKHKRPDLEVQSAGIFAGHGQEANPKAVEALQVQGISCDHASQPVTEELMEWADVVLTMTAHHKLTLEMDYDSFKEKVYTLKEYVRGSSEDSSLDIDDPIGLTNETYVKTLNDITKCVDRFPKDK